MVWRFHSLWAEVPVCSHVQRGDAFGMIRPEAMDKKRRLRGTPGPPPGVVSRPSCACEIPAKIRTTSVAAVLIIGSNRALRIGLVRACGQGTETAGRSYLSFMVFGFHVTTLPRSMLRLLSRAAPAARKPNVASSITGLRVRTESKKFRK